MKSVVEMIVHAPQADVAALFFDPLHYPRWMHDVARIEPHRGNPGDQGSSYRLVPKGSNPDDHRAGFIATVVEREAARLELVFERSDVTVVIHCKLVRLSDDETQVLSQETFRFKGMVAKAMGWLARRDIDRVHRSAMYSFKHFAEGRAGEGRRVALARDGMG
jgi:hypothetical protein